MTTAAAPSAKLLPSNYEKGMLIDDEWMAGVSKETEGFSVFIVDHLAGEALLHRTFSTLDAALQLVNKVPRAWRYESTSGCSGDRCEEGKCKGEGCKIYTGPKKDSTAPGCAPSAEGSA